MLKPWELFNLIKNAKYKKSGLALNWTFFEDDDTVYLLFQESDGLVDWWSNLFFFNGIFNFRLVHRGFRNEWISGCNKVIKELKKNYKSDKKFIISGWSNGGAMAQLAQFDIYKKLKIKADEVITFGSPSVFIFPFNLVSKCALKFSMYANNNDIVTKVPIFPYVYLGKKIKVGNERTSIKRLVDPWKYHTMYGDKTIYPEFNSDVKDKKQL